MTFDGGPLKILLVEDSPSDADLVVRELRGLRQPFEHARVDSEAALRSALDEFLPDVVLSDFSMPGFSGEAALEIVLAQAPDTPLVFVSGAIGEELAIDALKRGAVDYVLKDNLRRLSSAVERALQVRHGRIERKRIERELQESENRFRSIVENSRDWIWEIDLTGRMTYCNAAVARLFGHSAAELIGRSGLELLHPDERAQVEPHLARLIERKEGWQNWRLRWLHRDGSERVLVSTAVPILDAGDTLTGYRGIDRDVTEIEQQQARIAHLARLHAVLSSLGSAVLRAGTRQSLLEAACRVAVEEGGFLVACIGYMAADGTLGLLSHYGHPGVIDTLAGIGRRAPLIRDPEQMSSGVRVLRSGKQVIVPQLAESAEVPDWVRERLLASGVAAQALVPIGSPPWAVIGLYAARPQAFDEDEVALFNRLGAEIDSAADFIAKAERLNYLAYFSPVSGLPNRTAFRARLEEAIASGPQTLALVDIRRFSAVNESRGRAFGDHVLREVGRRLRDLASPGWVAHLDSDTFALLYPRITGQAGEHERLAALLAGFEATPFEVQGQTVRIDLRAGMAFTPEHGTDAETIEHNALAARVEGASRGLQVHVFDEELRGRATSRLKLESELGGALERHEFELFYQPKFDAARHRLVGAEALLRWRHPERGLVSPSEFIPALEESGLIQGVGHWVMREALSTAISWRARHPGLRIAVNVSARELRRVDFLDQCIALLGPHADDQLLDIEVTESLLMEDIHASTRLLDGLRALGCRIAIDDFGTGYSSLNYLTRLPVDTIKIDQSFVAVLTQSPQTLSMVTNIIGLAHSLSLTVVAEGVEEEGQAQMLRLLRCDVLQGFLFGYPVRDHAFAEQFLGLVPAPG